MTKMNDLERDIEESRARLDRTIDKLQDRMNASGVADDVLGTARRYGYGSQLDQAAAAIRNNPIPVLLVAAGIGWLALSMTDGSKRRKAREELRRKGLMDRPPRRHVAGDPTIRDTDVDPLSRGRTVPPDMVRTEGAAPIGAPPVDPITPARPTPYEPVTGTTSGVRR
ncbi:DUF3618 domain-containing protein [Salinarimonas ramus]|uniref:DUF3618 domain-containing protein n=1 Tax=Salinarimonas ramus TaxID=690164 RepID=A0A917Q6S2_9HYPH|nr:DUF3618 domain-containing protein [Salinarimonas ramus]GGK30363.1 hypothetical protein GCM10011322_16150 [Salinarimonas ramus]